DPGATALTPLSGSTVALPIGAIAPGDAEPDAPRQRRPRRRRRTAVLLGTLLLLALGGGAGGWWWFTQGPGAYLTVPEVVGLTEDQAVDLLTEAGLDLTVEREHHDTAPESEVFAADPGPGERVHRVGSAALHVSRAILLVEVPDGAGRTQGEAGPARTVDQLTGGTVGTRCDAEAPQGQRLSLTPA